MGHDLPDDNQESGLTPLFSDANAERGRDDTLANYKEFIYEPGQFYQAIEVPGSATLDFELTNGFRLQSVSDADPDMGEFYPFTEVSVIFGPSLRDNDMHELELVGINNGPWSPLPETEAMLRELDESFGPEPDLKAHVDRLNKALSFANTNRMFVVAIYNGTAGGIYDGTKIAAEVVRFIFHPQRQTIEPVITNIGIKQEGLLPIDFTLPPKWLYLLQPDV